MRLIQYLDAQGRPRAGQVSDRSRPVRSLASHDSVHALALAAIDAGSALEPFVQASLGPAQDEKGETYGQLLDQGRVLPPLMHPDPARCLVSGTGLTHLGSASTRDAMHQKVAGDEA